MYKLSELIGRNEGAGIYINGVVCDSRQVMPGNAFFCIKGGKCDGASFIDEALRRGARAIICSFDYGIRSERAVIVTHENVRSAYTRAVSVIYGEPSKKMKMIAVTGTNGKTTVSKMIHSALIASGKRCALIGTLGASFEGRVSSISGMTTPDPEVLYCLLAEYANAGAEYVVMEASSHALAQSKLDGIAFEVGAVTNLTAEHLDYHGDMESYYRAKLSLFDRCKTGVFLCDDYYTVRMHAEATCKKVACSALDSKCAIHAENPSYSFENGTAFDAVLDGKRIPIHSSVPAFFTVSNALLAFSVLKTLSVSDEDIYMGIASLSGVDGRMERVETEEDFSVFIDFAHTPDALSKLLSGVKKIKRAEQRVVTLFGCGGDRDRSKRSLMGAVASRLSDFVIITADNSRSESVSDIIDEIMLGFDKSCPHIRIEDREQAIKYAIMNAGKGDIILLCGKGHEGYEISRSGVRAFCEKDIVRAALKKRKEEENLSNVSKKGSDTGKDNRR